MGLIIGKFGLLCPQLIGLSGVDQNHTTFVTLPQNVHVTALTSFEFCGMSNVQAGNSY